MHAHLLAACDPYRAIADNTRTLWDEHCEAWERLRLQPTAETFETWMFETYGRVVRRATGVATAVARAAKKARVDGRLIAEGAGDFLPLIPVVGHCDDAGEYLCITCCPTRSYSGQYPVRDGSEVANSPCGFCWRGHTGLKYYR